MKVVKHKNWFLLAKVIGSC